MQSTIFLRFSLLNADYRVAYDLHFHRSTEKQIIS